MPSISSVYCVILYIFDYLKIWAEISWTFNGKSEKHEYSVGKNNHILQMEKEEKYGKIGLSAPALGSETAAAAAALEARCQKPHGILRALYTSSISLCI